MAKQFLFFLLLFPNLVFLQESIESKFNPPNGYERIFNDDYSKFLRGQSLKKDNIVKYFNGGEKYNYSIWAAVLDYDIGKKNLHQCADAVLYMRSSFLYEQKLYDKLSYKFVSGFRANYNDYLDYYYKVAGNKVSLIKRNNKLEHSNETFRKWIRQIWTYSNTWSIDNYDSISVPILNMKPGDFFIQSNPPPNVGHAVNVVDVVYNSSINNKKFMLSQSYMPAQETHILINPKDGTVWYDLIDFESIITPEWTFNFDELKRFKN